jgi:tRNA dimethylallyltransferase
MNRAYIIAGPTAGGKSARALELAALHDGVIINADSLQIYQDLPMLSACPSPEEMAQAPHKLYAFLQAEEAYSAQIWREAAEIEIRAALSAGKTPIICGGTGFYILALTRGLSPIADVPDAVRDKFIALAKEQGSQALHAILSQCDPDAAARLHPNDTQRLIRACEVFEGTGKTITHWQSLPRSGAIKGIDFNVGIIMPERAVLHERCNLRFELMVKNGVLDEVAALDQRIKSGEISSNAAVTRTLGFGPLQRHINGEIALAEAITLAQIDTRQYAKRQSTFFNNQNLTC